jgi:4-hydroxythreonine-4-phosphate dehydrogenase
VTFKPLIAITLGDPSGIGPEVVAKALMRPGIYERMKPFVIGTVREMEAAARLAGSTTRVTSIESPAEVNGRLGIIEVLNSDGYEDAEFPIGENSVKSGRASHAWVERAARLCIDGEVDAMATAPVNKESWQMSGSLDLGHQEVFRRLTGSDYVATMLVSGDLRCMHLSTHKSLRDACDYVTTDNVLRAVRLTNEHFNRWGFPKPRIAVAGLNPHASDNGLIGREELEEIAPAVAAARSEGIDATGPHPSDSVFNKAIAGEFDVVVVMYHDQGHIAIKVHGFEESISVNLGIPFIRTSVDHGTAFDIAGKNLADETGMIEALGMAAVLATRSAPADAAAMSG